MTIAAIREPAGLTLDGVRLGYRERTVLERLDLAVAPGEILVVVGKSGCGKSSLLRALAGLRPPEAGAVRADGELVTGPSADRALVFQDDALLPWRTARRNIELALRLRGVPRPERRELALRRLDEVGLTGYADYLPRDLSGGMRQRVQLARALAAAPRALLMDEPFGALDTQTRAGMQRLLVDTWRAHPTTVVFVTHDLDEALRLGDRIAVLGRGATGAGVLRALVEVPDPRTPGDRPAVRAEILEHL
ncbi:ATP-binding cassette domain-containing protein [Nocardia farcinica]|uniref:ABC transporter ATP-binding protein n=1 Tax=Nocardia farcinica TaxID=37329 RepID=UPI001892E35C|nr:ATP-binding cassette domain-containing protein [Nocardia farcinica]MBF6140900.1 ATP-binding cassette domain-containing protein [Nocardia farcinica]MBF6441600.1 ATP-binding cassette domain-containing protein [Nocardia farcinica]MBF6539665.1 ATP-binding cassette domain-containing protein [Nocardia farcinica]